MPISSNTRRPHVMSNPRVAQDDHQSTYNRGLALARAGRLDEFAELAFGLPNLNRAEAPLSNARCRAPVAQDAVGRAVARVSAREAAVEATALFPNMNRLAGDR